MGALVGKGKSALGTEPLHVAGENEALVQDNLITLQSQCARNTKSVSYTHLDVYKRQILPRIVQRTAGYELEKTY